MATRRKKPAAGAAPALDPAAAQELGPPAAPAPEGLDPNDPGIYDQALRELQITVPVAACRLVGTRLEFRLYGGRVLYWPPTPPPPGETKKGK